MVHVLVRHKVEDFSKWKAGFDAALDFRKEKGELGAKVFQSADDPNNVFVLLEWDNKENAHAFMQSDELKVKMEEVGVVEEPEIHFLNET